MRSLARSLLFVVVAGTLASLVGCSGSIGGSAGSGRKFRVAVIPKGTSHDFWYSVHAGAKQADDEFDDLEITWKGPASEGDISEQIKMVESFLADGYDGICLAPLDARAMRKPVDQVIAAKVPVVIFDSGLDDSSGIVSYVATNNYRGGQVAGEHLAKLLDGRGKVILIRYDLNSRSTEEREQGFLDALSQYPDINFLEKEKHAGPNESDAINLAENLLSIHGTQVDGIFCPNQSTTSGMLTVLRRAGQAGKVKFVGFDAGENIAQGIEQGEIHGTVLQDPVGMGYDAVRAMREHLLGHTVEARIETKETLATPENCQQPEIRALLYPVAIE
ncbi:MAG: substrate-binding domain-containing protein [Pirellulales bacterium]